MMDRYEYYQSLKALAREKRALHGVDTYAFGLREVRKIYKAESIRIDQWPLPTKIKALYMCADGDYSVAIRENLPDEPKIFALIHELKHHYCDQSVLADGTISCGDYNASEPLEIGAEVFAAEFIYPEEEFLRDVRAWSIENWQPEDVVNFKRTCKAKVSYKFITKRLEFLHVARAGTFDEVKFQKLEEQMYGVPFYKRRRNR